MARRELEAALRRDPGDEQAWTVFGDLLGAAGDRRGELIALEQRIATTEREFERQVLRHQVEVLFEAEHRGWLGQLGQSGQSGDLDPGWTRGFAMAPTIRRRLGPTLSALLTLESRTGALLRTLAAPGATGCTKLAQLLVEHELTDLDSLDLPDPAFERVAPLAALTGLRHLSLARAAPEDLDSLGSIPALERLTLPSLRAALLPFADAAAFPALRVLDLSFHGEPSRHGDRTLDPLAAREGLRELDLGHAAWTELHALEGLHELERLILASTDVFDLRPLMNLTKLRELDLRGARAVADLHPLSGMSQLEVLRLAYTRVSDLGPLRVLPRLRVLDLEATAVPDVEDLLVMPALERVTISGSAISNIEPLLERGIQVLGRPPVTTPSWRDLANALLSDEG